jgi:hypothetical protein
VNLGTLQIELAANVAKLRADMDAARRVVDSTSKDMQRSLDEVKKLFGGIFAGVSAVAFVSKLTEVQRQFDVLNSSLVTVTGSSAAAAREFAWLKDFAATTPFQLNEVTQAFIKMKALGLDASRGALVSYGNTASAMGKSLNQMIEAVADAATGEFERLKEFGIKAKSEGDRVTFTFRGVATEVGKNAAEIAAYLRALGEDQFAGAMALRAATLDGAISNLADTWNELFRTVSSQGAGTLIYDTVKLATGAIEDAVAIIKSLSAVTGENARETGAMAAVQEVLATVFETVAVLGANVKYVLVQVGNELGGIAAQGAAILSGNFDQAAAIRRDMIADGEQARREIDATTARILSARETAKKAAAEASALRNTVGGGGSGSTRTTGSGVADEKALKAALKRREEILEADARAALERIKRYDAAELEAARELYEQTEWIRKARADAARDADIARMDAVTSLDAEIKAQREANAEIGLTTEQLGALRIARMENALAVDEETLANLRAGGADAERIRALEEQIGLTKTLIQLRRNGAASESQVEAAKRTADEWKRTGEQIEQGLVDSLFRAAEAGKGIFSTLRDALRGMFNNLVLRPVIQAAVGGLGLGGAGSAMAGGGGAGSGSMLSSASSLAGLSGLSGAFGSGISAGLFSGAGLGGSMTAAGSLLGTGTVAGGFAGAGMAIGAAAPYALAAVAAYKAIRSLTRRRTTGAGIEGTLGGAAGFEGNSFEEFRRRLGGSGRSTSALDPTLQSGIADAVTQTRTAVSGYAEALGLPVAALQTYTQALRIDTRGLSAEQIQAQVAEAVQGFADGLAGTFGEALTAFAREGESASETLTRLSSSLTSANAIFKALGQTLLDASAAGGDAASQLIEAFGGAERLASAATAYLGSYYSDAERAAIATREVQDALAPLGLALPGTRDEFRRLVESMDLTTDYGRRAYATLLQVAPQFDMAATAAETAAQAATDAADESARAAIEAAEARVEEAKRVREAWADVGSTLLDEVRRIQGEIAADPTGDFASLTARARAGDSAAALQLPEAARAVIEAARASSADGVDFARAQAAVAASLGETAGFASARANAALPEVPTFASANVAPVVLPVAPVGGASVNANNAVETAFRQEVTALREELRAANATIAANTAETARILARWDGDSMPPAYVDVNGTA